MTEKSRLLKQYSGDEAREYDRRRETTRRFRAETLAFDRLLDRARPRTVLDVPFGTGRWLEAYAARQCVVTGVDLSADMLAEAGRKVAPGAPPVTLRQGSIFDGAMLRTLGSFDLVVCVRFLNWVGPEQALEALRNLDAIGSGLLVVGVSTWRGEPWSLRRLRSYLRVANINLKRRWRGQAREHVHDARAVQGWFDQLGWEVVERAPIFSGRGRDNTFLLLRRRAAGP